MTTVLNTSRKEATHGIIYVEIVEVLRQCYASLFFFFKEDSDADSVQQRQRRVLPSDEDVTDDDTSWVKTNISRLLPLRAEHNLNKSFFLRHYLSIIYLLFIFCCIQFFRTQVKKRLRVRGTVRAEREGLYRRALSLEHLQQVQE